MNVNYVSASSIGRSPRLPVTPRTGWLTVNRECNMRCGWCYAKGTGYSKVNEMSLSLAKTLLLSMKESGVGKVILIGGEPTLWDYLFEFNIFARDLGVSTTLVTNGTRFAVDSFWIAYQDAPCNNTNLSIKAFDEESYRCVTGRTNFQQTKVGISRALSLQDPVNASVVYTGQDLLELVSLSRFAKECGAKSLSISPSTPSYVNGHPEPHGVTEPQKFVEAFVNSYNAIHEIFNGRISLSVKLPLCMWPRAFILKMMERNQIVTTCQLQHRTGLLFDTGGNLISCNSLPDYKLGRWGNEFADTSTLQKHLTSDRVVNFYDHMNSYASTKCTTCSMRQQCGGGCPLYYGVFRSEDLVQGWD